METKIKLTVQGLTNSRAESGAYALLLAEDGLWDSPTPARRIPVIVGTAEAQSIAIALEGLHPTRPLTHDLFTCFAEACKVRLEEVFIYKVVDGVFFAEMLFSDGAREIRIESRTSDAVAIALRMKCGIYTTESIVRQCGIVFKDDEDGEHGSADAEAADDDDPEETESLSEEQMRTWLHLMRTDEVEDHMRRAILEENYEFAKLCKEDLSRREAKKTE